MRSAKLLVSTLALGLVFALTGTMAAQNGKTTLNGGVAWYNACDNNQSIVNAPGSTEVNYQQNGTQATVHVAFHNSTTDGDTRGVTASAAVRVPFRGRWGKGTAIDAVDRRLIDLLKANDRDSCAELARQVGLSSPAVQERVGK